MCYTSSLRKSLAWNRCFSISEDARFLADRQIRSRSSPFDWLIHLPSSIDINNFTSSSSCAICFALRSVDWVGKSLGCPDEAFHLYRAALGSEANCSFLPLPTSLSCYLDECFRARMAVITSVVWRDEKHYTERPLFLRRGRWRWMMHWLTLLDPSIGPLPWLTDVSLRRTNKSSLAKDHQKDDSNRHEFTVAYTHYWLNGNGLEDKRRSGWEYDVSQSAYILIHQSQDTSMVESPM